MSDRRDDLERLRVDLQERMVGADSDQNFATLGRLLRDVIKDLDEIPAAQAEQERTAVDEVTARRAARVAGAAGQA